MCSVPGVSWVPWGLSWVPWGYHDAHGGISWCTWGILWVPWGMFSTVGGIFTIITPMDPLALYGASYMCRTHHLNNYHHNSNSIGIMWGIVCFWAASSLSSLQQTFWVSYGTHLYKCFWAASTLYNHYSRPCGYQVELHMRPAWTSVWGSFHTIVTRSDTLGIMRLHMGLT